MTDRCDIVAVTGHPTGAVHAIMAKEALERAAAERGRSIRVEVQTPKGTVDKLSRDEIEAARAVIIAADIDVDATRFADKPIVGAGISSALSTPAAGALIDRAWSLAEGLEPAEDVARDFVSPDSVFIAEGFGNRDDLLDFISRSAVALGYATDAATLKTAFLKREAEGTTGMMDGFAVPHAKSPTVRRAAVVVVRDDEGVDGWQTMDGLPVTVAIALLIPEGGEESLHLRLLSRVAEALMDEDFRAEVKVAGDSATIAEAINERLG